MKTTIKVRIILILLLTFIAQFRNTAQSIIGAPTNGLPSDPIVVGYCYDPSNAAFTYKSQFAFSGFTNGVLFSLEISSPNGIFDAGTKTLVGPTAFVASPGVFTFKLPSGIAGENYRLRVKSNTNPVVYSNPVSAPKPAYYMPYNKNFTLNGNVTALGICGNSSLRLEIDAKTPTQDSPKALLGLMYKWYKDGVIIPGATGVFYDATSSGSYYCEIDYGSCSPVGAITKSQTIAVSITTNVGSFSINSSLGTTDICPSNPTTLSTTPGYTYQWKKNGIDIPNATSSTYQAGTTGIYTVVVSPGTACQVVSSPISITAKDFILNIIPQSQSNVYSVKENESITLTADTDTDVSHTYEWFEPNNTTPIETTSVLTLFNDPNKIKLGIYELKVKLTAGCIFSKSLFFTIKSGVESIDVPNIISPNDQNGENDFWILPQEYKASNIEVLILDAYGKEVFKTFNYQDNWPKEPIEFKSVNPIYYYIISKDGTPVKKGALTVLK